jgi:TPR repeat protein
MRFYALAVIILFPLSVLAAADANSQHQFDYAMAKMRDGDYAEAYCYLKPLAEQGDNRAQYTLGWMYHNGYGLRIDDDKALAWWKKSAAQKDPDALFALGLLYEQGLGVKKDPAEAARLYLWAAERGNEDALSLVRNYLKEPDSALNQNLLEEIQSQWQLLGRPFRISSKKANVRRGPGTKYKTILQLEQDDQVTELSRKGHWVQIGINGQPRVGWVHESLLEASGKNTPIRSSRK